MEQNQFLNTLGLDFKKALSKAEYQLPPIDSLSLTNNDIDKIRNHLSKVSSQKEKATKQVKRLLLSGRVEEIQREGSTYIFSIAFFFLGEAYLINLANEHQVWMFHSIQYTGKATASKRLGLLLVSAVLLFGVFYSLESFGMINLFKDDPPSAEPVVPDQEEMDLNGKEAEAPTNQEEPLTFEELQLLVNEFEGYSLITNEEKNHLLEINNEYNNLKNQYNDLQSELEKKQNEPTSETYIVYVSPGMRGDQVSNMLYNAGVINSPVSLQKAFKKQKVGYNILKGTHKIPKGSSYDEIVSILTTAR